MCEIYLDPCEVWSETKRRARKQHRCDCCSGQIKPGDEYIVNFNVFEGVPSSEKMCLACEPVRKAFCDAHNFGSCTPSSLDTLLAECIVEGDEESEQRWQPMLDTIWQRRAEARGLG